MKKLLSAFVVCGLLFGCVGMEPIPAGDRTFEIIFEMPGYSKEQIFNGAKIWIAENFRSAKAVLEYENKEEGTIIGNGNTAYPCGGIECIAKYNWKLHFTMRVDIKEQKFRLTFINLEKSWPPSWDRTFGAQPGYQGPIIMQGEMERIKPVLLRFGDDIFASLQKGTVKKDW